MYCSKSKILNASYPGQTCGRSAKYIDGFGRVWCTYHAKRLTDAVQEQLLKISGPVSGDTNDFKKG